MIDEKYEVSRDEYVGFIKQIPIEARDTEIINKGDSYTEVHTYSKDKVRHFAARIIDKKEDEVEEKYYVIDFPLDEERCAPQVVRKITLETKEEVQAFFNALNKIKDGGNNNE